MSEFVSSALLDSMREVISEPAMRDVEAMVQNANRAKRLPRIAVVTSPVLNACDYYRAYMITKMLARFGLFDVQYLNELGPLDLYRYDMFVVFRPKAPELVRIQADGKLVNCRMLVDYDDNIFNVMPSNFMAANFTDADRRVSVKITEGADQLTVSTASLRGILQQHQPRASVIPNLLDWDSTSMLLNEFPKAQRRQFFTVGWAGSQSHLEDLMGYKWPYLEALIRFMEKHDDVRLFMMGMITQELLDRFFERIKFQPSTGLFQYLPCLARVDLDLMTYPLIDHPFNVAKSNIRWLECSAIKVPVIAAHIPSYANLGDKYCKTVPNTTEAWFEALEYAYHNRDEMTQRAEDSHAFVRDEWTIQKRWPVWAAVYTATLQGHGIVGDFTPDPSKYVADKKS